MENMTPQMKEQLNRSQIYDLETTVEDTTEKIRQTAEAGMANPTAEGFKTILSLVKEMSI